MRIDSKAWNRFALCMTAGLLLRLALMPLTFHDDLFFINYFPSFLSQKGIWDIYGYFGEHFIRQVGYTYYPPPVYYFIGGGQFLLKSLNPDLAPIMERYHHFYYNALPVIEAQLFQGYSTEQILKVVFWTKAPYGILEAGILIMMWKLFSLSPSERMLAFRLWMLSPVVIFSIYVMGQHRLLTAFFVWGTLLALEKNRLVFASLSMGVACLCDSACWLFVPPSMLILGDKFKDRVIALLWMGLPVASLLIPLALSSSGLVTTAYYAPLLQKQAMQGIFRHQISGVPLALKVLFVTGYFMANLFLLRKRRSATPNKDRLSDFASACLAILLLLYATTSTVIHYFMWAMPFVVYLRAYKPKWHVRHFQWVVILLFFFNLDSRRLNLGLFMPLDPFYAMSRPSWHEWVLPYAPWWGSAIAFSRLCFSMLCISLAWGLVAQNLRNVTAKDS